METSHYAVYRRDEVALRNTIKNAKRKIINTRIVCLLQRKLKLSLTKLSNGPHVTRGLDMKIALNEQHRPIVIVFVSFTSVGVGRIFSGDWAIVSFSRWLGPTVVKFVFTN